jgi:hypothetical protein
MLTTLIQPKNGCLTLRMVGKSATCLEFQLLRSLGAREK